MTIVQHEMDIANDKVATQYPDEFAIFSMDGIGTGLNTPLFVTDRPIYIDSFTFRVNGTLSTTPGTAQHSIGYAADGDANTDAENNKVTETIVGDGAGGNMVLHTSYSGKGLNTTEEANRIPTGALVCLVQTNVTSQAQLLVTVRYRTRPA